MLTEEQQHEVYRGRRNRGALVRVAWLGERKDGYLAECVVTGINHLRSQFMSETEFNRRFEPEPDICAKGCGLCTEYIRNPLCKFYKHTDSRAMPPIHGFQWRGAQQ